MADQFTDQQRTRLAALQGRLEGSADSLQGLLSIEDLGLPSYVSIPMKIAAKNLRIAAQELDAIRKEITNG